MRTSTIRKYGGSHVISLSPELLRENGLKLGDIVNISNVRKVKVEITEVE